jgi:hypothetical protein
VNVLKALGTEINKIVTDNKPSIVMVFTEVLKKGSLLNPLALFKDDQSCYGTGMYIGDNYVLGKDIWRFN